MWNTLTDEMFCPSIDLGFGRKMSSFIVYLNILGENVAEYRTSSAISVSNI